MKNEKGMAAVLLDNVAEEIQFVSSSLLALSCQFDSTACSKLNDNDNLSVLKGLQEKLMVIQSEIESISAALEEKDA